MRRDWEIWLECWEICMLSWTSIWHEGDAKCEGWATNMSSWEVTQVTAWLALVLQLLLSYIWVVSHWAIEVLVLVLDTSMTRISVLGEVSIGTIERVDCRGLLFPSLVL